MHKCSYCKHRVHPLCISEPDSFICRECVKYIPHFDQKSEYCEMAYAMANSDVQARRLPIVYEKSHPPALTDVDEGYDDKSLATNKSSSEGINIDQRGADTDSPSATDDIRNGFINPDELQVPSADPNELDCKYTDLFLEQGVLPLKDGQKLPLPFTADNFGSDVTVEVNGLLCTFKSCPDTARIRKNGGGSEHKSCRFYRIENHPSIGLQGQLHRYALYDAYVNLHSKIFVFRSVITNPNTSQKYVWLHVFRGPCGAIV